MTTKHVGVYAKDGSINVTLTDGHGNLADLSGGGGGSGRVRLTDNLSLYFKHDGSDDTGDGLSWATAFLTPQKSVNVAHNLYDLNGFILTIYGEPMPTNVNPDDDYLYPGFRIGGPIIGQSIIVLRKATTDVNGNPFDPTYKLRIACYGYDGVNPTLSPTGIEILDAAEMQVFDVTLRPTHPFSIGFNTFRFGNLDVGGIEWENPHDLEKSFPFYSRNFGVITNLDTIHFKGNFSTAFLAGPGGFLDTRNQTFVFDTAITCENLFASIEGSQIYAGGMHFTNPGNLTTTNAKAVCDGTSVLDMGVEGLVSTYLPGTNPMQFITGKWQGIAQINGQHEGKLTWISNNTRPTTPNSSITTLYYTADKGNLIPIIFGGYALGEQVQGTQATLALSSSLNLANKNFDVFMFRESFADPLFGTAYRTQLGIGPAWSTDTARGSGAGTSELMYKFGILVNKYPITLNNGSTTYTVLANEATAVGGFRTTSNGVTKMEFGGTGAGGVAANLFVCNYYNRRPIAAVSRNSTDSWTYGTATWRNANNTAGSVINIFDGGAVDDSGFSGEFASARYSVYASSGTNAGDQASISIGVDGTNSSTASIAYIPQSVTTTMTTSWEGAIPLGLHTVSAMEYVGQGTTTFYGDAGNPAALQSAFLFRYAM